MPPKKIQVKSKSKIDTIEIPNKKEDKIIKVEKLNNPKQSIIKSNIQIIEPKIEEEQEKDNYGNPVRKTAFEKNDAEDLKNLEGEDQDLENPERKDSEEDNDESEEDNDESEEDNEEGEVEKDDTIVKSISNDIDNLEKDKNKDKKDIRKLEKIPETIVEKLSEKLPNKDKHKVSEKKKDKESKDKESKVHNHSKPKTITASTKDVNTVDMFGEDDLDFRYVMMNYDYTKNITMPKITKYEKALLIGKRAKQIEEGANPNVKYISGQSVISIAEEELRQRKIPLIIKRPIGNKFEYWKPADMEVNMD